MDYNIDNVIANEYVAYFGFAPFNRAGVAVLDTAHQTNYTEPTIS